MNEEKTTVKTTGNQDKYFEKYMLARTQAKAALLEVGFLQSELDEYKAKYYAALAKIRKMENSKYKGHLKPQITPAK